MIYLERVSSEELEEIRRYSFKVEPVHEIYSYSESKSIKSLVDKLLEEVGIKFEKELTLILSTLSLNFDEIQIALSDRAFVEINTTFRVKFSRDKIRELLEIMDRLGYITFYLGYKDVSYSIIKIEDKLKKLYKKRTHLIKRDLLSDVSITDTSKTKVNVKMVDGTLIKSKRVVYKTNRGMKGIKPLKDFLYKWNSLMLETEITVSDVNKRAYPVYNMKFIDSLEQGGRMYAGDFQTLPSERRPFILINGNKTVELDFKACHPRMIACLNEVELPLDFDPYSVEGYSRDTVKDIAMSVLYSNSKFDGVTSVSTRFGVSRKIASEMIDDFLEHNSYMEGYTFKKDQYKLFQWLDSEVARSIINYFVSKDIYILSYHDSFRLEEQYKEELRESMRDSYVDVLSRYKNNLSEEYVSLLYNNCIVTE